MKQLFSLLLLCFCGYLANGQQLHHRDKRLPCLNKTFSIYAHVVRDENGAVGIDEEGIRSVLAGTNLAFAPICAKFELCKLDTIDNYNYAEFERGDSTFPEMNSRNQVGNRINFYFVNEIRTDVCGFAGLGQVVSLDNAYVVIACNGPSTVIHELGHLFGLPHTFEGNQTELVNGSNCETTGDLICDTPADPFTVGDDTSDYVNGDCEFISLLQDSNGHFYQPDVGNYMSYYPCSCGFSYDQYVRMAETYLNSDPKIW